MYLYISSLFYEMIISLFDQWIQAEFLEAVANQFKNYRLKRT